ncbi:MAG TPA: VOC family protein [Chloroflexota bacterium]|nr:VOC family protein [Chloroflexota bacterium]
MAPKVTELNHWTLVSSDIPRTVQFYVDGLGATQLEREFPTGVALGNTVIDIFPATDDQRPMPGSLGQHHAYTIRLEDYDEWAEHLRARGAPVRLACHGPRLMTMYTQDPDGYHIELVVEFENAADGQREIEKRGIKRFSLPGRPG